MKSSLEGLLLEIFSERSLLYAVLSAPKGKATKNKISIRPIETQTGYLYQVTTIEGNQAFHKNLDSYECRVLINQGIHEHFKQALLCTPQWDYHVLVSQKNVVTILKKPPSRAKQSLEHNRTKQYLLEEGTAIPFLVELGIMDSEGKVFAKKRDKFRQLNRFVEMVDDILPQLDTSHVIHIVDFGCGKAYLTFVLYHYLVNIKGIKIKINGLDLKKDVIDLCQNLAEKLDFADLTFSLGDIIDYNPESTVDMVISLHACDTATDAAIAKAVLWKASVILCVPCCQHELFGQLHNPDLVPLLRYGILKERFAALVTDAARAQLLEMHGYATQILEFIDLEHTPKNILIRAIKRDSSPKKSLGEEYEVFKKMLGISPSLEKFLQNNR